MYKFIVIPILALLILFASAQPVRAEENCGFLCQIFGWDAKTVERTQIKEDAKTDHQRLENERLNEEGPKQTFVSPAATGKV